MTFDYCLITIKVSLHLSDTKYFLILLYYESKLGYKYLQYGLQLPLLVYLLYLCMCVPKNRSINCLSIIAKRFNDLHSNCSKFAPFYFSMKVVAKLKVLNFL